MLLMVLLFILLLLMVLLFVLLLLLVVMGSNFHSIYVFYLSLPI